MTDARRAILEQVRTGDLTPDEAVRLLESLGPDEGGAQRTERTERTDSTAGRTTTTTTIEHGAGEVRRIAVRCAFGTVTVIGDPGVREAVVEGTHSMRHVGDTLEIESEHPFAETDDDDRSGGGRFTFAAGSRSFRLNPRDLPLSIRMNPALALDLEVDAGTVSARQVDGPVKARVAAGTLRIEGFTRPIDLEVAAGTVSARGRLSEGSSRISCDAGKVDLRLDRGSSVRIVAEADLGKVSLPGGPPGSGSRFFNSRQEDTVGAGDASLSIQVALGAVSVRTEDG